MKLFLLSQNINSGYDTYDSIIVCAETEEDARKIHPYGGENTKNNGEYSVWADPEDVFVEEIGTANKDVEKGVVIASFNAG